MSFLLPRRLVAGEPLEPQDGQPPALGGGPRLEPRGPVGLPQRVAVAAQVEEVQPALGVLLAQGPLAEVLDQVALHLRPALRVQPAAVDEQPLEAHHRDALQEAWHRLAAGDGPLPGVPFPPLHRPEAEAQPPRVQVPGHRLVGRDLLPRPRLVVRARLGVLDERVGEHHPLGEKRLDPGEELRVREVTLPLRAGGGLQVRRLAAPGLPGVQVREPLVVGLVPQPQRQERGAQRPAPRLQPRGELLDRPADGGEREEREEDADAGCSSAPAARAPG